MKRKDERVCVTPASRCDGTTDICGRPLETGESKCAWCIRLDEVHRTRKEQQIATNRKTQGK
jgi:hypothetical protein